MFRASTRSFSITNLTRTNSPFETAPASARNRSATNIDSAKAMALKDKELIDQFDTMKLFMEVSERSERALMKTRILAMNPAKWLPT